MDVAFCWELWTSVDAMNPAPPVIGRFESFQRAANKSSCCCYLERGFFLHQCKRITQCMGISALPSRRQLPGVRERDWGLGLCGRCIFFISPSAKDTMRVECLGVCEGRVWGLPSCVSRGEEAKDCLLILRSCDMMEKKKSVGLPPFPSLSSPDVRGRHPCRESGRPVVVLFCTPLCSVPKTAQLPFFAPMYLPSGERRLPRLYLF